MKIFVKAKPNAKIEKLEQIDETHFAVAVHEPPKDGQANIAIQIVLAKHFKTVSANVRLVSGFSSKNKVFEVE